jgi:hypothetical protein
VESRKWILASAFVELRDRFFVRHLLFNPVTSTYLGADGYSGVAIINLKEDYKKRVGTAYSPRSFHQKLMRMGTVPVTYFREMFLMQ